MFDLPILVELLNYLTDRDTFYLSLTCRLIKDDILALRKRCNKCVDSGGFCLKKVCGREWFVSGQIWRICRNIICYNDGSHCPACDAIKMSNYYHVKCCVCYQFRPETLVCQKCFREVCRECRIDGYIEVNCVVCKKLNLIPPFYNYYSY